MALTINDFWGAETGGMEETDDAVLEIGIRLNIAGTSWNQSRLDKLTERAQALIDVRISLEGP